MILRDPVHGLVSFEGPEKQIVVRLLDTREVQRLRRLRMLGVTSLAFPGGEHSRFAHALGAAHVMGCFLARMRALAGDLPASQRLGSEDERLALAAAVSHDLGHGPLSHLFEEVFEGALPHEAWTSALLLDPESQVHAVLAEIDPALPRAVERLVHGQHAQAYLAHAVSGTFDVDRCDYLLRDSYMTGVRYGLYDLDWLLRSLRLSLSPTGSARLAVDGSKGLPAVEGFFLARLFMYQQVYLHKASRAGEFMVRALFRRAVDLLQDGGDAEGLPGVLRSMARGEPVSAQAYGSLDDGTVWGTIERWESAQDPVLRDLAARLRRRALFKTAAVDEEDVPRLPELYSAVRAIVASAGYEPRYYAELDNVEITAYETPTDPDEQLLVAYHDRPPRPLARASFLLGKFEGQSVVRRRFIFPGEVRDKVEALLGRSRIAKATSGPPDGSELP